MTKFFMAAQHSMFRLTAYLLTGVLLFGAAPAAAQLACANDSTRTNQIGRYAYHNIERNIGGAPSCSTSVGIPSDGIRVFSSWLDCRNGHFKFSRETGSGVPPTSLSCPNCTNQGAAFATLASDTSSSVTAVFNFADGMTARYTGTIARSAPDANGRTTCSITGAQVAGGVFGGDIVDPTVTLGALTAVGDGTYTSTITLSEAAGNGTAFDNTDLSLTNATAALSGAGTSFTATLTPQSDGQIALAVPASAFQDAAGNNSAAAAQVAANHDGTAPTVTLGALTAQADGSYTSTITLSEAAGNGTAFDASDLTLVNATATLAGAGTNFIATLRSTQDGTISLSVLAGAFQDAAGNASAASNTVDTVNRRIEETQKQVAGFMATRANNLASQQPELSCVAAGGCGGGLSVNVSGGDGSFNLSTRSSPDMPVWTSISGSRSTSGKTEEDYVLAVFGAHTKIAPNAWAGLLVELDYQTSKTGQASTSGRGWMAGPYFVAKAPSQPLIFEARALWGKSENKIKPFGTYEDTFETERMLLSARLSGEIAQPSYTLRPSLTATHTADTQKSYRDSLGQKIPAQTISLTQLNMGLDLSMPVKLGGQDWRFDGGIAGLYSQSSGGANDLDAEHDGMRGKITLGLAHQFGEAGQVSLSGFYDGIGTPKFESYGVKVSVNMTF